MPFKIQPTIPLFARFSNTYGMHKIEGLLLKATQYLGKSQLLKIFTPEKGLLTLLAKKGAPPPFCVGEWVYREGRGEMGFLQEVSLLDPLADLRTSYHAFFSAGKIARALLDTQWPEQESKAIYTLAVKTVQALGRVQSGHSLTTGFLLKLLALEGLLDFEEIASSFPEEAPLLERLLQARTYSAMGEVSISDALEAKMIHFFENKTKA